MDRTVIRQRIKALGIGLMLGVAGFAVAGTFNLFSPATGILVGNASTYVTTPATSTNVIGLWTGGGTCNSGTYLRGDGQCQAPPGGGGGTVNSVALSAPSVFGVAGSPVTTTGTLALSFATGQTANSFLATPDGSTGALSLRTIVADDLPLIDLTSGVTGTLPLGSGGTGATTLTANGVLLGNGTSAISAVTLAADALLRGVSASAPTATVLPNCGSSTQALAYSTGTHAFSCQTISAGTGTVTSVAQTVPSVFSITGSPVTTTGTLAIDWATGQTQNRVLASPNGSSGAVALRALVGADIPQISLATSGNGGVTGNLPVGNLNGGTGAASTSAWAGNGTWKGAGFLADTNTWSGENTFTASLGAPSFAANATVLGAGSSGGKLKLVSSGAATNAKTVELTTGTTLFLIRTVDDADSATSNIFSATRSGVSTTDVSLGNATSNPTFNLLGSGIVTAGGTFRVAAGSVGTPAYSFAGDPDTGPYSCGANCWGVSVGGAVRNSITSTAWALASGVSAEFQSSVIVGAPTGGAQGTGTINATGLYINGSPIATASSGFVQSFGGYMSSTNVGAACTVVNRISTIFPGTCTRNGTGSYSFTPGGGLFNGIAVCTASATQTGFRFAAVTESSGVYTVATGSPTTGVSTDASDIYVTCVANKF